MTNEHQAPSLPEAQLPLTDAEIEAATVGERSPLNGPVHLAPYDPVWPKWFAQEASRIREALGPQVLLLEHAGSTSVPGLVAKPIIDMVLAVADSADEGAYVPALETCGFVLRIREPDSYEHRLLRRRLADAHSDRVGFDVNLHVFSLGCEEVGRMLIFRDWLRDHADDRSSTRARSATWPRIRRCKGRRRSRDPGAGHRGRCVN